MKISSTLLQDNGLKETLPRRAVVSVLSKSDRPLKVREIVSAVEEAGYTLGPVTIYRVMEALGQAGLVHRHPHEGAFTLCSQPNDDGHHVLLSCTECGVTQETRDSVLCKREAIIAKKKGFTPTHHVSAVLGTCSHCR